VPAAQRLRRANVRRTDRQPSTVRHRIAGLLPRERQQLAHQIGGAVGVLFDLHDVGKGRVAWPRAQQQQIAKSDYRSQQIVEIVGDTTGKLADCLHLLRLRKLGFKIFLFGNVAQKEHKARRIGIAADIWCRGISGSGRQSRAFALLSNEPAEQ
jgi:hypothetical protein